MDHPTLRTLQESATVKMLNFNKSPEDLDNELREGLTKWKLLIYDEFCRDVILPILNTKVLRENGVTLHMLLHSKREKIADVDVIYFIQPTEENIRRICKDCSDKLYSGIHLNFCSPLPRPYLELLARETIQSKTTQTIVSVYDQFLSFISLEPDLFSLNMSHSFSSYNHPNITENDINSTVHEVCSQLSSVFITLGVVPIMVAPPNDSCSKRIVVQLDTILRDKVNSRLDLFNHPESSYLSRPLLIVVDRTDNPSIPLYHTTTYQTVMLDILDSHHNRVNFVSDGSHKETYYMDSTSDRFWRENALVEFTTAVENNTKGITEIGLKEQKIKNAGAGSNTPDLNAKGIANAVDSLKDVLDEKNNLAMHLKILKATMTAAANRDYPTFGVLEDEILTGRSNKAAILAMLRREKLDDSPTAIPLKFEDKLRLAAVYISDPKTTLPDVEEVMAIIGQLNDSLTPDQRDQLSVDSLTFLRDIKTFSGGNTHDVTEKTHVGSFLSQASGIWAMAAAQVKTYLPLTQDKYTTTQLVESISTRKAGGLGDGYLFYDPKVAGLTGKPDYLKGSTFDEIIVFVVGGGCYSEYRNLKVYGTSAKKNIIYGCTELVSGKEFLRELALTSSSS